MRVSETRSRVSKRYVEKTAGNYTTDRTDVPDQRTPEPERNAMHGALSMLRERMKSGD